MQWLRFLGGRRRRSPFNNLDSGGGLTCGRVTEELWVGGELGPRDWEALQKENVSIVINLQLEQQDFFAPHEKVTGYLWLPSPDGSAPSLDQLVQGVAFIRAAVYGGQKVFVHCKAGQGRAPLLCACYLIVKGMAPLEAIQAVRDARPRTLLTPEQSLRLREFAEKYGTDTSHATGKAVKNTTKMPPAEVEQNTIGDDTPDAPALIVAPPVAAAGTAEATAGSGDAPGNFSKARRRSTKKAARGSSGA